MQELTTERTVDYADSSNDEIHYQALLERIEQRTARLGVIGLGYVGLPLATAWARAGFAVTGIDSNPQRVELCQQGSSWIADIPSEEIGALVRDGSLAATSSLAAVAELDAMAICVPTPLNAAKEPDLGAVLAVVRGIAAHLHSGQLIILESTTYPGTTDEALLPCLQQNGLHVGRDFFLAFSPERVDPGNLRYKLQNTPKVVAGITPACLRLTRALYATVVERIVEVSSTRTAELVKLFENTFRAVNIGLVNELTIMSQLFNVNVWEVIAAASTKPYGFTAFYPGPGVGGHCIPIDPLYLSWKLRTLHYKSRFIEAASEINEYMPHYVVERISNALNEVGKCLNGSRILIVGVAYKPDVDDMRESPALDIIDLLHAHKAQIEYADPYVATVLCKTALLTSVPLDDEHLQAADCVVIVTNHRAFDYASIVKTAALIVDTRNATADWHGAHIWRL